MKFPLHAWLDQSIGHRLTLSSVTTAFAFVVLLGAIAFPLIFLQAWKNIEQEADNSLDRITARMELRLDATRQNLSLLSKNSFIVNSFVDSTGREIYLQPTLRDFKLPFGMHSTLLLFDANIEAFASNTTQYAQTASLTKQVASKAFNDHKPQFAILPTGGLGERPTAVMAFPIFYPPASDYEGVLVGLVDVEQLFPTPPSLIEANDCLAISMGNTHIKTVNCSPEERWIQLRRGFSTELTMVGDEELAVNFAETPETIITQLTLLLVAYLFIATIAVGAAFYFSRKAGQRFASKIALLGAAAQDVAEDPAKKITVSWERPDEIGRFVQSFNQMVRNLQDFNATLEKRVAERTVELGTALERAETANRAKSQFLATMSHEIRTPLNGILGMAQTLQMPEVNTQERQHYAQIIINSGQTLLTILNDILDLSKIEAGKIELEKLAFSPEQIIREINTLFDEAASAKGLTLTANWSGSATSRYSGDPLRLRQMLTNLVSNALKFTHQGSIQIEARAIGHRDRLTELEFSVTDTGIGIDAEKQQILFQPFSQVDASNTRQYGGTGLGLSIVSKLASLMHGEAGVSSEAGQGSRFWFRIAVEQLQDASPEATPIPVAAPASTPVATPLPTEPPADTSPMEESHLVLVVEDNPTNRVVVQTILKKQPGIRVETVNDGQEAVDHITQRGCTPSLVLMDCQMPVMDGYEATQRIRAWEQETGRERMPIVALTAGAFEEDRDKAFAAGMDDFLTKPIDVRVLKRALAQWCFKVE